MTAIKTISLTAFKSENNKDIPVSGESVMVYVPRMFSLLPVGEATLDENGTASLEFPSDLPGDTAGNLTIISKFEEHPDFGNVERRIVQKWGVPFVNSTPVDAQGSLDKDTTLVDDNYPVNSSDRCLGPLSLCHNKSDQNKKAQQKRIKNQNNN